MSLLDRIGEPISDEVRRVGNPWWRNGIPTTYRERRWRGHDGTYIVVATELDDNGGVSITNGAEAVYADIHQRYAGFPLAVVEHYEHAGSTTSTETFDLVGVGPGGKATWRHLGIDGFTFLLDGIGPSPWERGR